MHGWNSIKWWWATASMMQLLILNVAVEFGTPRDRDATHATVMYYTDIREIGREACSDCEVM
jgi:hypothetical protein